MELKAFVQYAGGSPTTLSEIKRIHDLISSTEFFGVYAYATQSGVASFDLQLGRDFWGNTPSKWLFGIDYGRTQPQALRTMCAKENAEVRIVDGAWLIDQTGFIPRRDFHAKMAFLLNPADRLFGAVIGSGNFSASGLRKNIEAGAAVVIENRNQFRTILRPTVDVANELWESATPAADILEDYEDKWRASFSRKAAQDESEEADEPVPLEEGEIFWIEAGYVTKNRGPLRPGNQIDFPRGATARYFGFNPPVNLAPNSVIGQVTFETPFGEPVSNNLRLGNNMMEKISLPIPETHGFDIYDGKVLVFQRSGDNFVLRALESDDFETVFGDRLRDVREMASGRRYGLIA